MISLGENCKHSGLIPLKSLGVLPFISMGVLPRPYNGCSHLSAGVDVVPSASQTPGNRDTPAPAQQARECPCGAEPRTTHRHLPQLLARSPLWPGDVAPPPPDCKEQGTSIGDISGCWLAPPQASSIHSVLGQSPCTEVGPPIWQQGPKQRGN